MTGASQSPAADFMAENDRIRPVPDSRDLPPAPLSSLSNVSFERPRACALCFVIAILLPPKANLEKSFGRRRECRCPGAAGRRTSPSPRTPCQHRYDPARIKVWPFPELSTLPRFTPGPRGAGWLGSVDCAETPLSKANIVSALHAPSPPLPRMNAITWSTPCPVFMFANVNGRVLRMRAASAAITSSEAPT